MKDKDWLLKYEKSIQNIIHECVWADKNGKKGILIFTNDDALIGVLGLNSTPEEGKLMLSEALSFILDTPNQRELH